MPVQVAQTLQVRWMIRRDMPEVLQIENLCFPQPWTELDFLASLRERNVIGIVAELGPAEFGQWPKTGTVAGFMIYELHKRHVQLLNFAVRPSHKRQGIGLQMLERLKTKLRWGHRERIHTEVRESNLAAQLFFQSQGFVCTEVLRGHYDTTSEDAYLFRYAVE